MTHRQQPNEIVRKSGGSTGQPTPRYNAVQDGPDSLWLRKKRQFGGLICPPIGFVPSDMPTGQDKNGEPE